MARLHLQVLSRRAVVGGLAASATLAACDDARLGVASKDSGAPPGPDTGAPADASDPAPLSPITANEDFYVTSCCGEPALDGAGWSCLIVADDAVVATLDLAWLEARAARDREHTLECIGASPSNRAISNAVWSGLPLVEILDALGVSAPDDAVEIVFTCADGYSTSLPVADLERPVWLVWRMNGEALPAEHGYPVRLLVPGRYGMKNPKWIVEIAFSREHHTGFWEGYGWSETAEYQPNSLVEDPDRRATVAAGGVRVQGMAFAGSDLVTAVQVRVDGGEWQEATLDYAPGADVWTLWHHDLELAPGAHTVQARCRTASGAASLEDPDGTDGLSGYDGSMEIEVEAR